ncbi:hypothetical protein BDZ89DRAFT_1163066 [Hymenopellis radicata]|nr:hypothetical protein BDZ89DRAFT_1163066 [Hymenopellis radicata]
MSDSESSPSSSPLATQAEIQKLVFDIQKNQTDLDPVRHGKLLAAMNGYKLFLQCISAAKRERITRSELGEISARYYTLWERFETTRSESFALDPPAAPRRALDQGGMTKEQYSRRNFENLVEEDVRNAQQRQPPLQTERFRQQPQPSGEETPQFKSLPPPPRKTRTKEQESPAQPQQSDLSPASQGYRGGNPSQTPYYSPQNALRSSNPSQPSWQADPRYAQQMPPPTGFPPSSLPPYGAGGQYPQGATGQGQGYSPAQGYPDQRYGSGNMAANGPGFNPPPSYAAHPPNVDPRQGGAGYHPSQAMTTTYAHARGAAPGQGNTAAHPTQYYQNHPSSQGTVPHLPYGQGSVAVYTQGAPPGQGTMFQGPPDATMYSNRGHNRNVSTSTFGHGTRTHTHNSSVANEEYAWSEIMKQRGVEPWDGESDSPPKGY